jgi:hypothetical protein
MLTQPQVQRFAVESGQLTRRSAEIDQNRITKDCVRGFSFLATMTPEEERLAHDSYQREQAQYEELKANLLSLER